MSKVTKQPIYLLDHKMKWKTFKLLLDKLVKEYGPVPEQGDKAIWELMRDRQFYCWFDDECPNDMRMGFELPKDREVLIITNPSK